MPNAMAEQTNVPRNDEELAAATEKRLAAEAVEQGSNAAARAEQQAHDSATRKAYVNLQRALHDLAVTVGDYEHHINATLHTVAVMLSNCANEVEEKRMIEFILARAVEVKAARIKQDNTTTQPKGE